MFIWLEKVSSITKVVIRKGESFLKSNFDLNQMGKIVLKQNHEIWNFNAADLLYIFIKDWRNALKFKNMPKDWNLKETGPSNDEKLVCSDSLWQKKLEQNKKLQAKLKMIRKVCFLLGYWLLLPKFNFWNGDWALCPSEIEIYLILPNSLRF